MLTRQDARCPLCGEHLLTVGRSPADGRALRIGTVITHPVDLRIGRRIACLGELQDTARAVNTWPPARPHAHTYDLTPGGLAFASS